MRWFGEPDPTDDDFRAWFKSSSASKPNECEKLCWLQTRWKLLLELTVVDESPQLGLFEEMELLFGDELFNDNSW